MTTLDYLHRSVIPAAYTLLPPAMNSPNATMILLAIAMQESKAAHRRQVGGPAHGFFQFEQNGGVRGVLTHQASRGPIAAVLGTLRYPGTVAACYMAIEDNDVLAVCFARCLLWTLPRPLPALGDLDGMWADYLDAWRPGKPHRDAWPTNFAIAINVMFPPKEAVHA